MTSCDPKGLGHPDIFGQKYLMSVTDGNGQTQCSFEQSLSCFTVNSTYPARHCNYRFLLSVKIHPNYHHGQQNGADAHGNREKEEHIYKHSSNTV